MGVIRFAPWFVAMALLSACGRTPLSILEAVEHGSGGNAGDAPGAHDGGGTSKPPDGDVGANVGTGGTGPYAGAGGSVIGAGGTADESGGSVVVGGGPNGGAAGAAPAEAGGAGGQTGTGGAGTMTPVDRCDVPVHAPTDDAGRVRAGLIAAHCAVLRDEPCLNGVGEASMYASSCGIDTRVSACELDDDLSYAGWKASACDAEWQAAAKCVAALDYTGACDGTHPPVGLIPIIEIEIPDPYPCHPEHQALADCLTKDNRPSESVSGPRGTCYYELGVKDPGSCDVYCPLTADDSIETACDGPAGGPFECACKINGIPLYDEVVGYNPRFFAASCEDAAVRITNGECIERVDCCYQWTDSSGENQCTCVSDPNRIGFDTCDAAAAAKGGKVVKLCDKYRSQLNPS